MTKPTILTVDDDPQVSQAISHDLRVHYGSDYSVLSATSGAQALAMLAELVLRNRPVALIATDQRMPEMTGIEMLGHARSSAPEAKFLLLTAYADTDVAIKAINDIGLDYYLLKPWDPPAERLYPVIDDLLGDWQQAHPQDSGDVRVVGHRWSEGSHEVKTFLARNYVPYRWLDVDKDEEAQTDSEAGAGRARRPPPRARARPRGAAVTVDPRTRGRSRPADPRRAAALRPVHRRRRSGRAGCRGVRRVRGPADRRRRTRSPRWTGGSERVDRELPRVPEGVVRRRPHAPCRCSGSQVRRRDGVGSRRHGVRDARSGARSAPGRRRPAGGAGVARRDRSFLPAARGARARGSVGSRRLLRRDRERSDPVPRRRGVRRRCRELGRSGSAEPGSLCETGGAGRARWRARGHHVALPRRADPRRRRTSTCGCAARSWRLAATATWRQLTLADRDTRANEELPTSWLFVFIGASPRTDWLGSAVARDEKGFVITGQDLLASSQSQSWPLSRAPVRPGDQRARRVRGRRRTTGLDEARGIGGRRGRHVGLSRAPLSGDDVMHLDDLRPLELFDGLARQGAGRADRSRRRGAVRARRGAVPGRRSRRVLVGPRGGQGRPGPPRRPRGDGARRDGRARPVGGWVPRLGRQRRLSRDGPGGRSPAASSRCRPSPCRNGRAPGSRSGHTSSRDCSGPRATSRR